MDGQVSVGISIVDVGGRPVSFDVQGGFVNIVKPGSGLTPAEKPQCIFVAHIDTAVTHREAEIVVPVGTMEGVANSGKETAPRHTHQWNDIIRQRAGGAHVPGGKFIHDDVVAGWCGQQNTLSGRDLGGKYDLIHFVTGESLGGQVDIYPFLTHWHIRGDGGYLGWRDGAQLFGWNIVMKIFVFIVLDIVPGFAVRPGIYCGDPMDGAVIQTVILGPAIPLVVAVCIGIRDRDLG